MHHQVVVFEIDRHPEAFALQRVRQRRVDVEIERVAVLVALARRLGLDAGRQMLRVVRAEARFPDAAQQVLERAITEKIDAFVGEIELHLLCRLFRHAAGAEHRLLRTGHLRRLLQVEVPLVDQLLDDLVEQIGELFLELGILAGVAGRVAAQHVEHVGRELPGIHEGLEDGLAQRVERAVGIFLAEFAPEGMRVGAAGEPRLQQEIGELIEQRLEVERLEQAGDIAAIRRGSHRFLI